MWMADKPLPQEQLAEQISNLVPIVGIKPKILVIFVEWFFRTMAREWNWIDRFRLDKFMMVCFVKQHKNSIPLNVYEANLKCIISFAI